jgi:hypothetical protein
MRSSIFFFAIVGSWISLTFMGFYFYQERNHYRDTVEQLIMLNAKAGKQDDKMFVGYKAEDLINARMQGKYDGKIEALLLREDMPTEITVDQVEKIISIAEKQPSNQQEENPSFLGLLCRAAYHKGVTSAMESAKKESEDSYADGYHAALEQFACPETGKIVVPQKIIEESKKK